jgi:methylglyoxal synthase
MKKLNIALVAHDSRKEELIEWCTHNIVWLSNHNLYGTGTTATMISQITTKCYTENDGSTTVYERPLGDITPLLSGPLGGDQQIGTMIAQGGIDVLIFFCDNLITQGHQQDVGALTRLASLYNIPFATNRTTADLIVTSPLILDEDYQRIIPMAIEKYKNRYNTKNI